MPEGKTQLHRRIESGGRILIAEVSPPTGSDPAPVRELAKRYAGKVHALGVSDNRDRVGMSAMAAGWLVAAEGVEPILHVVTRDRNRIALVSDFLGAQALGIRNLLCTTGTHQTLGRFRAARNVFDVDSIQLLQIFAGLGRGTGPICRNGPKGASHKLDLSPSSLVGEEGIQSDGPLCLGAVASPYADPIEMQVVRLAKKVAAGAQFVITQPIFDIERFDAWFKEVTEHGIHEQVAIVAGIQPITSAEGAKALAEKRPSPMIPQAVLGRLASKAGEEQQRAEGLKIARETIERLSRVNGLRGFQIRGDADAAVELIEQSGLETD